MSKRLGYSFVPDSDIQRVDFKGINLILAGLLLLGFGAICIFNFILFKNFRTILWLGISVVLGILLYYATKKEKT